MRQLERRDELLLLTAISGEIPADWIGRVVGSETYASALLTKLKRNGELKLRSKDGIRGYLLRAKAKSELLERYPDEVGLYLTGSVSTNHIKSEPEKRLRLHRMSMVWIFFYRQGIRIFQGDKPVLFPGFHHHLSVKGEKESMPVRAYYGTFEWKLETDKEIKGSRACGLLLGDSGYIVYNTMDHLMKWSSKIERNLCGRMEMRLRRYHDQELSGAMILGSSMEMLERLVMSDGGVKGDLFYLDGVYEKIYYIPFEEEASLQVHLLSDRNALGQLETFLSSILKQRRMDEFGLEAGRDQAGNKVYFSFLLELWQLKRMYQLPMQRGRIFCFTYQADALRKIFGDRFVVEAIRPEKVNEYLGWGD